MHREHFTFARLARMAIGGLMLVSAESVALASDLPSFHLYFQTTGDWSGSFTGSELGLDNHTIILYAHIAGQLNEAGPEFVDMPAHLAKLREGIDRYVPRDYDGLVVLDYEGYPLSFYDPAYPQIRDPRIEAQLRRHPGIPFEEAERLAAEAYAPYVKRFFLDSLDQAREMRPTAKWAFYSLVSADRNRPADERRRWINDQGSFLWDRVDAICSYSYTGYFELDPEHSLVESLMVDKAQEAVRLSRDVERRTGRRPLVLPYINIRTVFWGLSKHEGSWAGRSQVVNFLRAARDGGADGVILWQSIKNGDPRRATEDEYLKAIDATLVPALEELELGSFAHAENPGGARVNKAFRILTNAKSPQLVDRALERIEDSQATLLGVRSRAARIIVRCTEDRTEECRNRVITSATRAEEIARKRIEASKGATEGGE